MAKITVSTNKKIAVVFQERELARYKQITADIYRWNDKVFVDFGIPFITWDSHDLRCATDLMDALRKIGGEAAKKKGVRISFIGTPTKPSFMTDTLIRYPVYANNLAPFVQAQRVDGRMIWSVMGHYFNDDLPSVVAYVAALQKLVDAVRAQS